MNFTPANGRRHAFIACILSLFGRKYGIRHLIKHSENIRWVDGKYYPANNGLWKDKDHNWHESK